MALLAVALVAALASATAEQRGSDRLRKQVLDLLDQDKSGDLSPSEIRRGYGLARREGKDPTEFGFPATAKEFERELDADGDDAIDEDEIAKGQADGKLPESLPDKETAAVEAAARAAVLARDAGHVAERTRAALPEAIGIGLFALLPTGMIMSFFFRMHEDRGWRRPTWFLFGLAYVPVAAALLWAYFTYVPENW